MLNSLIGDRLSLRLKTRSMLVAIAPIAILTAGREFPSAIAQTPPPPTSPSDLDPYLLREPPVIDGDRGQDGDTPGSSITSPIGFGAGAGSIFAGLSYQNRARFTPQNDGGVGVGMGLGDPRNAVGLELSLFSASTFRRGLLNVGSISFKLHRLIGDDTAVSLGIENAINWGGTDGGTSVYGVASKYFALKDSIDEPFSSVIASVGLGGGRFRSESDIDRGKETINPFGSVGVRIARPISLMLDWSGQSLGVGVSIAPIRDVPLTINAAMVDLTSGAGDGARATFGMGYGLNF